MLLWPCKQGKDEVIYLESNRTNGLNSNLMLMQCLSDILLQYVYLKLSQVTAFYRRFSH